MRTLKILACALCGLLLAWTGWCWWQTLRMPPTFILFDPPPPLVYDTAYEEQLRGEHAPAIFQVWAPYVEMLDEPVAITRWHDKASTWEVFFGTNRGIEAETSGTRQERFGNRVLETPHFGRALVTLPPRGLYARPVHPPKSEVAFEEIRALSWEAVAAGVGDQVNRSRQQDLLLFVHGFNVDFESALISTAQLSLDLPFNGAVVSYCWPSQGGLGNYDQDEGINAESVEPFALFLTRLLADLPEGTRVNIVVHSMGNRLVMRAINRLPQQNRKPIVNLVLLAPDVGLSDFREWAPGVVARCERVTLYASTSDAALIVSKGKHLQEQRAGDAHPPVAVEGITTIDCSALSFDFLGHSYYGNNRDVLSDLFRLLKERRAESTCPYLTRAEGQNGRPYWYFSDHAPGFSVVWNFEETIAR
jgi:esterase/lipase superfamily enzyme